MPTQTVVELQSVGVQELALDSKNRVLSGALFLLLLIVYAPMLIWTARVVMASDDMAHAAFAPVIAGYVAVQKRKVLLDGLSTPSPWGLLALIAAAALALFGTLGDSTTMVRFACLISLVGCILVIGGFAAVRQLKFPLLLLLFTFPIPPVVYGEITAPLQSLATILSQSFLEMLGFSVFREGNLLELPHYRLSVVEACSGIRSLVTLLFFSSLYAYFLEKKLGQRLTIVALSIPCALLLNVVRITMTGVIGEWRPALTRGTYHEILGWVCLAVGFGLLLAVHRALRYVTRGSAVGA